MIPQTFNEWSNCIINDCKIALNKEFATHRLAVYQDKNNPETKRFISLYGDKHLHNIITWFKQITQ